MTRLFYKFYDGNILRCKNVTTRDLRPGRSSSKYIFGTTLMLVWSILDGDFVQETASIFYKLHLSDKAAKSIHKHPCMLFRSCITLCYFRPNTTWPPQVSRVDVRSLDEGSQKQATRRLAPPLVWSEEALMDGRWLYGASKIARNFS